jgi:hypothetical protein
MCWLNAPRAAREAYRNPSDFLDRPADHLSLQRFGLHIVFF